MSAVRWEEERKRRGQREGDVVWVNRRVKCASMGLMDRGSGKVRVRERVGRGAPVMVILDTFCCFMLLEPLKNLYASVNNDFSSQTSIWFGVLL